MVKVRARCSLTATLSLVIAVTCSLVLLVAGCGSSGMSKPTVTITANPTSITAGSTSTLTVTATNAATVTVTGSDGSTYKLAASGGTQTVKPGATTTYTATAASGEGTATATVTVTAAPPANPTVTVSANPTTITAGNASTLTIAASNATAVTVAGTNGSSYTLASANGGTLSVSPAATTTYTVTASGAAGTTAATATATVTVMPVPAPTVTLSATPTTITAGNSTVLTVTAANATRLVLTGTDGSSFTTPTLPAGGGTETVSPKTTATYTVAAVGPGGTAQASQMVTVNPVLSVTVTADPASIAYGNSSTLTVVATSATAVTLTGTDGTSYNLSPAGGTQSVSPTATTTYTATAGAAGSAPQTANATVTVVPPGNVLAINHVVFMLQENHAFDNYFGMLNLYRQNNNFEKGDDGNTYDVDGLVNGSEDKTNGNAYDAVIGKTSIVDLDKQKNPHTLFPLKSTCLDDMSSAWVESFNAVNLSDYSTTRQILMNGYADNGEGFIQSKCPGGAPCTGFTDTTGDRTMGYYDENTLNYYYYMASQFALSGRWFSPMESKSVPNRIATFTGGTTQGLTRDPGAEDGIKTQLQIANIFDELNKAGVSWKIYYTVTDAHCDPEDCNQQSGSSLPATTFSYLTTSYRYIHLNARAPDPSGCTAPAVASSAVNDTSNSFCIDLNHVAPLNDPTYGYFADLKNGKLPSFSFIESGSGYDDEHPGYQQSVLQGQHDVAKIINALMSSTAWKDSVFFFAYDEGGGPFDHVPPIVGHTNDFTDAADAPKYPSDVSNISISADNFNPCPQSAPGDVHCDLQVNQPGMQITDAAYCAPGTYCAHNGFGAQLGFRVPNMVISPFAKRHYVSHVPMDHTAVIKFVESRFIDNSVDGTGTTHLTLRDAAQPTLLDFFDFNNVPWATPPTPPTPLAPPGACTPQSFH